MDDFSRPIDKITGTLSVVGGLIHRIRSSDVDSRVFPDGRKVDRSRESPDLVREEASRPKIFREPLLGEFTLSGAMYGTTSE